MNQQPTDRDRPAGSLQRRDRVWDNGKVREVAHVQPYGKDGEDRVLVVFTDGQAHRWAPDHGCVLASEAEIAQEREREQRADRIADLRAFVDWLEANPDVPMVDDRQMQHSIIFGTDEEKRAEATRVAALLGIEVREKDGHALTVRKPVVQVGRREMDYVLHAFVEPEPAEPKSIEDVPPRGTDAAETTEPKPEGVAGYSHTERGTNGFTEQPPGRGYDLNPELVLGDRISTEAAMHAYAAHLDTQAPGWFSDPLDQMAPELAALAEQRRTGKAPEGTSRWEKVSGRYDPNPILAHRFDGDAYADHANLLDQTVPGWWNDEFAPEIAPELKRLAIERRHETYAQQELDQDRIPTAEGFEESQARREGGA